MAEKYISLREAAKYCHYSPDYLKLRAWQGKLKALKLGRNWVTTREWLEEYKKKNFKSQILNSKQISLPQRRQRSVKERTKKKPNSKLPLVHKKWLVLCLIIFLFAAGVFLLLILFEPLLEKIIPAKIIEIEK